MPRKFWGVMLEGFMSLREWFGNTGTQTAPAHNAVEPESAAELAGSAPREAGEEPAPSDLQDEALSEVRRFRASLADALEQARFSVLSDIAVEVVGRELQLQPAALRAIVERATERYFDAQPLAVRVHPDEVAEVAAAYPAIADATLRRGDVTIELRTGTVDARLGVRLERVLRSIA